MLKQIMLYLLPLFFLSVLSYTSLYADIIVMKDGARIEGKIVREDAKKVEVEFIYGASTYKRENIKEITRCKSPAQEYQDKLNKLDKDSPEAHEKLAGWCGEKGLSGFKRKHLEQAVTLRNKKAVDDGSAVYCPECNGKRSVECSACAGKKKIEKTCAACRGMCRSKCTNCSGGYILCAKCDGKGEISRVKMQYETRDVEIQCPRCIGAGEITDRRYEYNADTKQYILVPYVRGCPDCRGGGTKIVTRRIPVGPKTIYLKCSLCSGDGLRRCMACRGKGDTKCKACNGKGVKRTDCPVCRGKQKLTCKKCNGKGILPKARPAIKKAELSEPVRRNVSAVVGIKTDTR